MVQPTTRSVTIELTPKLEAVVDMMRAEYNMANEINLSLDEFVLRNLQEISIARTMKPDDIQQMRLAREQQATEALNADLKAARDSAIADL